MNDIKINFHEIFIFIYLLKFRYTHLRLERVRESVTRKKKRK